MCVCTSNVSSSANNLTLYTIYNTHSEKHYKQTLDPSAFSDDGSGCYNRCTPKYDDYYEAIMEYHLPKISSCPPIKTTPISTTPPNCNGATPPNCNGATPPAAPIAPNCNGPTAPTAPAAPVWGITNTNTATNTSVAGSMNAPLYRLSNPDKGSHMYTTNAKEKNDAVKAGWTEEPSMGKISADQAPGTVPLHRLYNMANGQYMYTTSDAEKNNLTVNGWHAENPIGCVSTAPAPGLVPLYRLSDSNGHLLFTTLESEKNNVINQLGWKLDGTTAYINP